MARRNRALKWALLAGALAAALAFAWAGADFFFEGEPARYVRLGPPTSESTGLSYLGREIAQPLDHRAAAWLERPERQSEERPDLLIDSLGLRPGMVVADIGAGTGYLTWRLAKRVAPGGKVLALDIDPDSLFMLEARMRERGVSNVEAVLGTPRDPKLASGSIDLALLVDVYHEMSHPYEMLGAITDSLETEGRVVFVEYRGEAPNSSIKRLHTMTFEQIVEEAEVHDLVFSKRVDLLPMQHVVFFRPP